MQIFRSAKGTALGVFDSWVNDENNVSSLDECIELVKAIVIVIQHSDVIDKLEYLDFNANDIQVIVDGRNCLNEDSVKSQNVLYRGIGHQR